MGLMDKLNHLTNEMNGLADKVTMESHQQFNTANVGSLEGLGNINHDNANGSLASPGGFLQKSDSSIKLLDTNIHNYASSADYSEYLKNFLGSLPGFNIVPAEDGLKQQLNNQNMFYAQFSGAVNFLVMCGIEYNEIQNIIQTVMSSNVTVNNVQKVLIGYFNYDEQTLLSARNCMIELIGINEYMEINSDAEAKIIPDLNFGAKQHSFKACLGRTLKSVNSGGGSTGLQTNSFGDFTSNLGSKMSNIGESISGTISGALGCKPNNTQNTDMQVNNPVSLEKGEENITQ